MRANSLNLDADFAPATPAANPATRPDLPAIIWQWFLRLVVVAFGILLGTIVAVFVGLTTGWIEISC